MNLLARMLGATLVALLMSTLPAAADDWVASKLRGLVYQLVDGQWDRLERNDVVSDDRVLRTAASGHVTFKRDAETIDLGPNTQIRIFDREGQRFTTVQEHFGTVVIGAEVQNVQHFAVETPFLAAVVKGTKFTVTSDKTGSSVKVRRGVVEVEDKATHNKTLVRVGQSVKVNHDGSASTMVLTDTNGTQSVVGGVVNDLLEDTGGLVGNVLEDTGDVVGDVLEDTGGVVGGVLNGVLGRGDDDDEDDNSGHGNDEDHDDDDNSGHGGGGLVGGLLNVLL